MKINNTHCFLLCSTLNVKDIAALQLYHEKAIWDLLRIFYVDEADGSTPIAHVRRSHQALQLIFYMLDKQPA